MIETSAEVISNHFTAPYFGRLRLLIRSRLSVSPGQFCMCKSSAQFEPLLRRPMAIYNAASAPEGTEIEIVYLVMGRGTVQFKLLRTGDRVEFLGPLGNSFPTPQTGLDVDRVLLVAGGVGSAGLFLSAQELVEEAVPVSLFFGAPSLSALYGIEDFEELGIEILTATEDGSHGSHGFVTVPLQEYLESGTGERLAIFCCGPHAMMRRVAEIATAHGVPAWCSLEARMACGFGVCVGCVQEVLDPSTRERVYKRVCVEGPIYPVDQIVW